MEEMVETQSKGNLPRGRVGSEAFLQQSIAQVHSRRQLGKHNPACFVSIDVLGIHGSDDIERVIEPFVIFVADHPIA